MKYHFFVERKPLKKIFSISGHVKVTKDDPYHLTIQVYAQLWRWFPMPQTTATKITGGELKNSTTKHWLKKSSGKFTIMPAKI